MAPVPHHNDRPDLYDGYDGLPEGSRPAVKIPPDVQKLLDGVKADQAPAPLKKPKAAAR